MLICTAIAVCLMVWYEYLYNYKSKRVVAATLFFIMDFSLLSMGEFLFKRNEPMRNTKPPAMRVRIGCCTKNHLSVTM